MSTNPLQQYFRQPAIYIRLPSEGKFYPPGALTETANSEYPVLPMTTMDEITYRTPDALFNGSATVSVIQSCVPNIRDAWHMPSVDIDTMLTAIRIASYGHDMDISTKCPACDTEAEYTVDLRRSLEQIKADDYVKPLVLENLELYLRPMTYQQMNANSMAQFEDQKILQSISDDAPDDEKKLSILSDTLKKITTVTTRALAENISRIKTPDAEVSDQNHIREWLSNCDRNTYRLVRDHILDRKRRSELQPLRITCGNCSHQYEQTYTLDMSNFFADAS
jgi:hypothetical protein